MSYIARPPPTHTHTTIHTEMGERADTLNKNALLLLPIHWRDLKTDSIELGKAAGRGLHILPVQV